MDIRIVETTTPSEKPEASKLGFGKIFTDHMFIMDYDPENGWHDARIVPLALLKFIPQARFCTMALRFLKV